MPTSVSFSIQKLTSIKDEDERLEIASPRSLEQDSLTSIHQKPQCLWKLTSMFCISVFFTEHLQLKKVRKVYKRDSTCSNSNKLNSLQLSITSSALQSVQRYSVFFLHRNKSSNSSTVWFSRTTTPKFL